MSKRGDIWMPLYIADYLRDTGRLTTEGHGAYMLLLMDYWVSGPPRDDDTILAAITRLPLARWRKLRPRMDAFFEARDGLWHQKRADREMAKAGKITAERRAAGIAGAAAKHGKSGGKQPDKIDSKPVANAMANEQQPERQTPQQTPTPITYHKDLPEPTIVPDAPREAPAALPSSSDRDERTTKADLITAEFLRLREQGWPNEPRFPSPLATLRTQALGWLDAGGTVELCNGVMAHVVEQKRAKGEPAPTNLHFARLSVETAITRALTHIPGSMLIKGNGQRGRSNGATPETGEGSYLEQVAARNRERNRKAQEQAP